MDELSPSINAIQPNPANPCVLIIFGIGGDLTKRLLFPAICNLGSMHLLNKNFSIVGLDKKSYKNELFREEFKKNIKEFISDNAAKNFGLKLLEHIDYISGDFSNENLFIKLKKHLDLLSRKQKNSNYLFYFAVPPACIEIIIEQLIKQNLLTEVENGFRRIVVEKPFGSDLASAINLNRKLHSLVNEKQIYRIDHFLGKETVQNLLLFRFSNGLFEPIWNRLYIDHVQITVAETIGIELRGNYYEQAGALRDMVPNHIFQMLSLFAMEPPISFSAYDIHAEKMKVLRAIQTYTPELVLQNAVRGQYDSAMINNQNISSYRTETNVNPQSVVETYVALKLFIDNWRWLRVPFYIRTGKRLPLHTTEIIVQFKSGPPALFKELSNNMKPNLLKIYIQPDEGISLMFNSKIPGPTLRLDQVEMKFKYKDYFGIKPETGYEMILYDCMQGDHLLFKQADMVEMSWRIVQPILDVWHAIPPKDFPNYKAGTWGPISADELLSKDGRRWIL